MTLEELKAAYEAELAAARAPVERDDLPLSFEAMSDAWLTATICRDVPGAQVVAHQLGPEDEGNTSRRRIMLSYNADGEAAGLPASVFCKASFHLGTRMSVGVCGGIAAEVEFYRSVRPRLDIQAPRARWANYDPVTFNSIIMLDDMRDVQEFCTLSTDMTEARLRDQMDTLARLHARFYRSDDSDCLSGLQTWPEYMERLELIGFSDICKRGFSEAAATMPARLYARAEEVWPATEFATRQHVGRCDHLAHGDVHLRNWFVAADGSMGLADWQVATRAHWSRDAAYAIVACTPFEARPRLEKPLLDYFLRRLADHGGPVVAFEDAWQDYIEQLFGALSFWTVTIASSDLPDMQPQDSTIEMMRRITHAIDDNEALDRSRWRNG